MVIRLVEIRKKVLLIKAFALNKGNMGKDTGVLKSTLISIKSTNEGT